MIMNGLQNISEIKKCPVQYVLAMARQALLFTALSPQAQSPKKAPVQQVRAVALRAGRRRHLHWKVPVVGCAGKAGDEGAP